MYKNAENYSLPMFISKTGCNKGSGNDQPSREFLDQAAVLGPEMNDRISGNVVFEWAQHSDNHGLVSYANGDDTGTPSTMADYSRLQKQWATLSPEGVKESAYNPTLTAPACPDFTAKIWDVKPDATLPTIGMEGLTATSLPTPGARQTGTGTPEGPTNDDSVPVGAIVGGVVGGVVVITLLLGAFIYFRRRARKTVRGVELPELPDDTERSELDSKLAWAHYATPRAQELDPTKGDIAPLKATELPLERTDDTESGAVMAEMPLHHQKSQDSPTTHPPAGRFSMAHNAVGTEPSPFVDAQRRMELDWLESEEARMRQKREVLLAQQQRRGK